MNELDDALAGNTTLEVLMISKRESRHGCYRCKRLRTLTTVLCDTSSLASLCQSNHTLYRIVPMIITTSYQASLLKMNKDKDKDKARVVRKKLLMYFFSTVDNIGLVFGRMATSIMPNAVEWIGRDRRGYRAMFEFCRSVPALFKDGQ